MFDLTLLIIFWKAAVTSECPTNTFSSQALSSYYTCAVACLCEAGTHEHLSGSPQHFLTVVGMVMSQTADFLWHVHIGE